MKSILLASASIAAFAIAGAAQAEVSFGGDATIGFNDDPVGDNDGFYYDGNVAVTLSQDLGNGLTASAIFNFDYFDNNLGQTLESGGVLVGLSTETAGFFFGDITEGSAMSDFAAVSYWNGAGEMAADGFSEADGETTLAAYATFGAASMGISYIVDEQDFEWDTDLSNAIAGDAAGDPDYAIRTGTGDLVQLSLGATYSFGNYTVGIAYQEGIEDAQYFSAQTQEDGSVAMVALTGKDVTAGEIMGIFGTATIANADVTVAYASTTYAGSAMGTDEDSFGIAVAYPFGPVTVSASYADNSESQNIYTLGLGYDNGAGLTVAAEYEDGDEDAAGVEYDANYSVDATYAVLDGVTLLAGFNGGDANLDTAGDEVLDYYIAASTVIGEGATMTVSYAEDDDFSEEDEIGEPEYQAGTTVELSLEF